MKSKKTIDQADERLEYKDIIDHSLIGIYTLNKKGIIDFFNPKMTEFAGLRDNKLIIGLNALKLDSYKKVGLDKLFRKGLKGQAFEEDVRYVSHFKGKVTYRNYKGAPIFDDKGKVKKLLLMVGDITERTQIKNELQGIFKNSPEAIILLDHKGKIVNLNDRVEDWLGYRKEEIIGKSLRQLPFWTIKTKLKAVKEFLKRISGKEVKPFELEFITKKGDVVHGLINGALVSKDSNLEVRDLVMISNVTDRKQAENQIKQDLERQKLLAKISVYLNNYSNFEETINKILKDLSEYFGVTCAYIFEDTPDGKATNNTFEWRKKRIKSQISNLQNIQYKTMPYFLKSFKDRGMLLSDDIFKLPKKIQKIFKPYNIKSIVIFPLKINNKRIGFMGFHHIKTKKEWKKQEIDLIKIITTSISSIYEKRQKNQEIVEQKNKIETIINGIGDGVFVVDNNLNIILFNPAASKISGFSEKEVLGKKYSEILKFVFEKNTHKSNDSFIHDALKTGEIQAMSNHTILITKQGKGVVVRDSAAPLRNNHGDITGCVVVFRDATNEREIDRMKTEFVSVASHQLKTPLTGIKWMSELLLREKITSKQRGYVIDVGNSANRLIKLVDDLLNVSHIETGRKFNILKKKSDIVVLIKTAIKNNKLAEKYDIKYINFKSSHKKIFLNIDAEKITQSVNNLLDNAIKYSKKGSSVSINIKKNKNNIIFNIKDGGVGIPAKQQERIFDKFFRADNAVGSEADGTGLGLYIVKSIVDGHGGKIWFSSKEDHGTNFYFSLPI